MRLLHEITIFQTVKSKLIISLFETVRLSVSISLRILYNSLNSIKEINFSVSFSLAESSVQVHFVHCAQELLLLRMRTERSMVKKRLRR